MVSLLRQYRVLSQYKGDVSIESGGSTVPHPWHTPLVPWYDHSICPCVLPLKGRSESVPGGGSQYTLRLRVVATW
eukprot:3538818-Rhodomonas_salina.4